MRVSRIEADPARIAVSILAAYDLGASASQLEAIYKREEDDLDPIHLADRKARVVEEQHVKIAQINWTEYVGQEKFVCGLPAECCQFIVKFPDIMRAT